MSITMKTTISEFTAGIRNTGIWAGRHPDRTQCMKMLEEYGTPPHVIGHCKAVAAVGYTLAQALNERRRQLEKDGGRAAAGRTAGGAQDPHTLQGPAGHMDPELVLAAGLLHDMARTEDMHWEAAARWCESRGMNQEAAIIRVHMTYDPFHDLEHLNEMDIVCMADRVVIEDRYAGIERRMEYIIAKAERNGHPEHRPHILRKMGEAKDLISDMEQFLGRSMDELMEHLEYDAPEELYDESES